MKAISIPCLLLLVACASSGAQEPSVTDSIEGQAAPAGAGPNGMTVKALDAATIQAYMAAAEGFETFLVDGRIWVFAAGDPAIEEFLASGEPAVHVIRVGAGPQGMTVKAPDRETIDAYLKAAGR